MSLSVPTGGCSGTIGCRLGWRRPRLSSRGQWTISSQGIPGVCVYIDDILIAGSSDKEHLDHLNEVLRRLAEAGMRLKKGKCAYLLPSVEYLGHIISAEGLGTADSKVFGILKAPAPRNVTELRSFLGLVNYYRKFLPDLATTLSLLYALLQKQRK